MSHFKFESVFSQLTWRLYVRNIIKSSSALTYYLLDLNLPTTAGRLAGAYKQLGKKDFSEDIINAMTAAKYQVKITNPFHQTAPLIQLEKIKSPYHGRIISMWANLREDIIEVFPKKTKSKAKIDTILHRIDDIYLNDAYHSLSIEGYHVNQDLIEKIRGGKWNQDSHQSDADHLNAMAAKGYYDAFLQVKNH